MHEVHGDAAWGMPPPRMVQDNGIRWGLGKAHVYEAGKTTQ